MKPTYEELEIRCQRAEALCKVQQRQIEAQQRQIEAQQKQIESLLKRIADLEARLNQNSKNSSKPPSSDQKSNRSGMVPKGGGRKGHPGVHRVLFSEEAVTHREERTLEKCPNCGSNELKKRRSSVVYQQVEAPEVKVEVHELRVHRYRCQECGCRCTAEVKKEETEAFGPRLGALVNWMGGGLRMTHGQIREMLEGLFKGLKISVGSINALKRRMAEALYSAYKEAETHLRTIPKIRHTDATGWRHQAKNCHVVVIRSLKVVLYAIWDHHGKKRYQEALEAQIHHTVVCDRASVHDYPRTQYCLAHIIRNLTGLAEHRTVSAKTAQMLGELQELFQRLFHDRHRLDRGEIQVSTWKTYGRETFVEIDDLLDELSRDSSERVCRWVQRLRKDRPHLDTYLNDAEIPMTNNAAERALRAVVIARKLSFGSRSDWGLLWRERIHTVIASLKAQGRAPLDFLTSTLQAFKHGLPAPSILPS